MDWKKKIQASRGPLHKAAINGQLETIKVLLESGEDVDKKDQVCVLYSLIYLYYYMENFYNLIGLEQWYFTLIWNTYMWKLQTFYG